MRIILKYVALGIFGSGSGIIRESPSNHSGVALKSFRSRYRIIIIIINQTF